jgi:hypothetical protein
MLERRRSAARLIVRPHGACDSRLFGRTIWSMASTPPGPRRVVRVAPATEHTPPAHTCVRGTGARHERHLSVDEQTIEKACRVAQAMHKSLNQVIREYLEQLARQDQAERDAEEFRQLSSQGRPDPDWKFNRDEIYDRKIFR